MVEAKKKLGLAQYFDSGALIMGDDEKLDLVRLPSGIPQLDEILGGGYPYGRNILVAGPESTGKTILGQYLIKAQQQAGNGRERCLLVDAEMSFTKDWWAKTGVDYSKLMVAHPASGEEAVDIIVAAMAHESNLGVVVLDSIATLSPTAILEKAAGERTMSSLAHLVSNLYTRILPLQRNGRTIFFAINQLRDAMNGGFEDVLPGGRAQKFNSHIRLHVRRQEWIKEKEVRVGYVMQIHARKNKTERPEGVCEVAFRFDSQMDLQASYIDDAIEKNIITTAGPYYYMGESKFLGKANLREYFSGNADAFEQLRKAVEAK